MSEVVRNPRPAPIPLGLIGMAVLVLCAEIVLTRYDGDFADVGDSSHRFPGLVYPRVAKYDVLCFGDSLAKHGVVPRVIERRLGVSAYNLAISGGSPAAAYILLRRVLDSGGRPTAVLVDFKSRILSVDPRRLGEGILALPNMTEAVELCREFRDARFASKQLVSRLLTSYRDRYGIRSVVWSWVDPGRSSSYVSPAPFERNWRRNQGAQLNAKNPVAASPEGPPDVAGFLLPHWQCDPRNQAQVLKFLELAADHGLRVYWLLPPIHPKVQSWRDQKNADAAYERFVQGMLARFPNVQVVDARHARYGADLFVDSVHLDRDGAVAFTEQVAEHLRLSRTDSRSPRWVKLPRVRPATPDRSWEDMAQSALAVSMEGNVRR
jgi:hypothetical protein